MTINYGYWEEKPRAIAQCGSANIRIMALPIVPAPMLLPVTGYLSKEKGKRKERANLQKETWKAR